MGEKKQPFIKSTHVEEISTVMPSDNKFEADKKVDKPVADQSNMSNTAENKTKPKMSTKNIFGDSSDDEDIFADLHVPKPDVNKNKKASNIFSTAEGSDSDDIFSGLGGNLTSGAKSTKNEVGATSSDTATVEGKK